MKLLTSVLILWSCSALSEEALFKSVPDSPWSESFTQLMNKNQGRVFDALADFDKECVQVYSGTCKGFYERVNWTDPNSPTGTRPGSRFHGYCSMSGNNCEINTDAAWGVMIEGKDDQIEFVRVYRTYREL